VRDACKLSRLDKNDVTIDDAVSALARERLPTILARVPDLARLRSLIWSLHHGVPEPEAPPQPETAPATRHPQPPKKEARRTKGVTPTKRKRS
jgi:hypothetical protein